MRLRKAVTWLGNDGLEASTPTGLLSWPAAPPVAKLSLLKAPPPAGIMRQYHLTHGAGIFSDTFRRLRRRGVVPGILYPAVSVPTEEGLAAAASAWRDELPPALVAFLGRQRSFLSINRFERKKVSGFASSITASS